MMIQLEGLGERTPKLPLICINIVNVRGVVVSACQDTGWLAFIQKLSEHGGFQHLFV
jgi:hypothetical protein